MKISNSKAVLSTLSPKARLGMAAVTALMALPGVSRAADVTLTASNGFGVTSFDTGVSWSDATAPSAANNYFVGSGLTLRTPPDSTNVTFAGNSLTIGDNGAANGILTFKNLTGGTVTVNNLTLNRGEIQNGGNQGGAVTTVTLAGNGITLAAGGGILNTGTGGRTIIVAAPVTGSGPLSAINGGLATLTGTNTYTGLTTVTTNTTLNAVDGVGLSSGSALLLSSGVLGTTGTFSRSLGTAAGQVQVGATGGFSAIGGPLVVSLGGAGTPTALTLGSVDFAPTTLTLNNGLANNTIEFQNAINFNGIAAGIAVATNTATVSGVLSDSTGTAVLNKSGGGILALTAANTYAGQTNVTNSVLRAVDGVGLPTASNLNLAGGIFESSANFSRTLGTGAGQVQFAAAGTGGFSSFGADTTVSLNGGTPLVWGTTAGFNPNNLVLNSGAASNAITFANDIDLSTATAATTRTIVSQNNVSNVTGVISNTGAAQGILGIEGNGTGGGTVVISGNNTYGGTTLIDTGAQGAATVRAVSSTAFGTSTLQFNGAGNATTARLELANNITLANNLTFIGRTNASVAVQSISGNNTMSGTLGLTTGGNTYTVQSDAGSLLTLSGATGTTAGVAIQSLAGARVVTLTGAGNGLVSGVIRDSNAVAGATVGLTKAGLGTWTLTNANTYTGATTVNAGTLALGNGGSFGTAAVVNNANVGFSNTAALTVGTAIGGTGTVSQTGTGTTTITGANTYAGATVVSAGTLRATSPAYTNVLANAGGVDLGNTGGKFVFDYTATTSPVATVKSILTAGFAGNFATGQIRSTTLAAGRTIGYGDDGVSAVTARVTLGGDADLDGDVDFNDFLVLQTNFGGSNTRFDQGNFNYDSITDFNDFLTLQTNFGQSVGFGPVAFSSKQVAAITAFGLANAVPEPAALGLIGLAGMVLTRRRLRS